MKKKIRCLASVAGLSLFISGCSGTPQVGKDGLINGMNEKDIEKQTSAITGLSGETKNSVQKRQMAKPETEFFPEMPKNTLKALEYDKLVDVNKVRFKNGGILTLIGIQMKKEGNRREVIDFMPNESTKFLKTMLDSQKKVYVEIISGDEEGEMYGYLWIGDDKQLRNINALLIQEGYAKLVRVDGVNYYDTSFYQIEQEAFSNKLGIWKNTGRE